MFEGLKNTIKKKFEENTIKNNLTWYWNGEAHNEVVYLKRSRMPFVGDWARVYPPVNLENNKWNIINLTIGGFKNFIKLIFFLSIVALFVYQIHLLGTQNEMLREIPCVKALILNGGLI